MIVIISKKRCGSASPKKLRKLRFASTDLGYHGNQAYIIRFFLVLAELVYDNLPIGTYNIMLCC